MSTFYNIGAFPNRPHPMGSTQPVPIIDHVLGEAYYVVKSVYQHLEDLESFLDNLELAQETKEALIQKITEAQEKLADFNEAYERFQVLSNKVDDNLAESQDIFNQIQLIKLDADGVQALVDEVKELSVKIESEMLTFSGLGCIQTTWVVDTVYGSGAQIDLDEIRYLVGRSHLRISWNGLILVRGVSWEEVGTKDQLSKTVKFNFSLQEGDEINAWVVALGKEEVAEAVDIAQRALLQIQALTERLEEDVASLRQGIEDAVAEGVHFRGKVTSVSGLPTQDYKAGWQYTVSEDGVYAGQVCEVGDLIICIKDFDSTFKNSDWSVLQANYETEKQDKIRELTIDEVDAIEL